MDESQPINMGSRRITLPRTGNVPVTFIGRLIAEVDGGPARSKDNARWHSVRIYQTDAGSWVAGVEYHSDWQGEEGRSLVFREADLAGLSRALLTHEPAFYVRGYPRSESYNEKQAELLRDIKDRYLRVAGAALAAAGAEERID